MKTPERLLLDNKSWAQERRESDPSFFERMCRQQTPEILWIGCSDSRVPANVITGTDPGEVFVHRNIANLCPPADLNLLSVLQYAVEVLQVQHVIVCGHYGCGGIRAAMTPEYMGPISHWLRGIRDVYHRNYEAIQSAPESERADRLCECSVREQAESLAKSSTIQEAWHKRQAPTVHAWVYSLQDGILHELAAIGPATPVPPAYRMNF